MMNRLFIPFLLVLAIILLLCAQCTFGCRFPVWGAQAQLLPPVLLYAAFTVNLPTAVILGLLAAAMFDSFSAGSFGASAIPYVAAITVFCAVRPIFFRNRISTQFVGGCVFGFISLGLQWLFSGKVSAGWHTALPVVLHLALFCGVLAVFYFAFLDFLCRRVGVDPGRFEEVAT